MADEFWGFAGDFEWGGVSSTQPKHENPKLTPKNSHRRTVECKEYSTQYEYRRAFSELHLIDAIGKEGLQQGKSYAFITGGDVDALSYLKLVLRYQPRLRHALATTWCMAAEDILQFREWVENGVIGRLDIYVGEIFPSQYKIEWAMLRNMYQELQCGKLAYFRNHSKIFAGVGELFDFGIQTSANINTNPRTENGCITIGCGLYDFYKQYFDGIKSFDYE